jgi:C_GCAxxG_C_C family probable redox protein
MDDMILKLMKMKAKGFCCAQIILLLALEVQSRTNVDLVRSVGGLCFGIYGNGEVCGALSGGACLISLYAGKGGDEEAPHARYMMMMAELTDWFHIAADSEYGGTRCDEILKKFPDRSMCGQIVANTYRKCMDILASHGFDPAVDRYCQKSYEKSENKDEVTSSPHDGC